MLYGGIEGPHRSADPQRRDKLSPGHHRHDDRGPGLVRTHRAGDGHRLRPAALPGSDQMAGKEGVGSWQFKKIKKASEAAGCMVKKVHYFTGISDLSYCGTCGDMDFSGYAAETPLWGGGYQVDFEEIGKLNIPAVLMGPWGKDIHRRTERVNRKSLLVELPEILHTLIEDQA